MERDILGYRARFGVLGPSTNTIVEPEFSEMRPAGVTNHYSRIVIKNASAISNETFMQGTLEIDRKTYEAVEGVLTMGPDYLVMGMSAVTFYGGAEGAQKWKDNIQSKSGLKISLGSEAVAAALKAHGNIKKIAFLSPYYPVANAEVANYLSDHGYETVRDKPLQCPSWHDIARVTPSTVRETVNALNGDDVDAIVQVGTNLCMARQAERLEMELNKPVIAINTATYWHALRANGIEDKISGFGRLLSEF